jgi:hypothetical protein
MMLWRHVQAVINSLRTPSTSYAAPALQTPLPQPPVTASAITAVEVDQLRRQLTSVQAERDRFKQQLESSDAANASVMFMIATGLGMNVYVFRS